MCLFAEVWNINFYFIWWLLKTVSERKSKMWRHSPHAKPSHHPCDSSQMKYRFNPTVDQPASLLNKQKTDKWSFCCPPSLLLKLLLYFLLFFIINFIQKLVSIWYIVSDYIHPEELKLIFHSLSFNRKRPS